MITELPNLNRPIFLQWQFGAHPPNWIPTNIYGYTVCTVSLCRTESNITCADNHAQVQLSRHTLLTILYNYSIPPHTATHNNNHSSNIIASYRLNLHIAIVPTPQDMRMISFTNHHWYIIMQVLLCSVWCGDWLAVLSALAAALEGSQHRGGFMKPRWHVKQPPNCAGRNLRQLSRQKAIRI